MYSLVTSGHRHFQASANKTGLDAILSWDSCPLFQEVNNLQSNLEKDTTFRGTRNCPPPAFWFYGSAWGVSSVETDDNWTSPDGHVHTCPLPVPTARLSHTNLKEKYHSDAFLVILYNRIQINVYLLQNFCPGLVTWPCDPHRHTQDAEYRLDVYCRVNH